MKKLHIILGNQLFPINKINKKESSMVFMAEDYDLCSEHAHDDDYYYYYYYYYYYHYYYYLSLLLILLLL